MLGDDLAGAEADVREAAHHGDEAVVAERLELADRPAGGLLVGLGDEAVEQLVGQLGDVGELASTATAGSGRTGSMKWRMPASPPAIR